MPGKLVSNRHCTQINNYPLPEYGRPIDSRESTELFSRHAAYIVVDIIL